MGLRKMDEKEIQEMLQLCKGWRKEGDEICKIFEFPSFLESITFVNQVAALAETVNHHPDILIQYNKVKLSLITHDVNGISSRDKDFALRTNEIYK